MSTIIINNNPEFICKYDVIDLPQFDLSKKRDMEILLSQLGGARVRGDQVEYDILLEAFNDNIEELSKTEHGKRMANAYYRRFTMFINNPDGCASKYIIQWLDEKLNR